MGSLVFRGPHPGRRPTPSRHDAGGDDGRPGARRGRHPAGVVLPVDLDARRPQLHPDAGRGDAGRDGPTAARPHAWRRPFPTVIEYSGYQIAAPKDPLVSKLGIPVGLPTDPLAPPARPTSAACSMRLAGFAVVSVQLRGSGCSGGEAICSTCRAVSTATTPSRRSRPQPWVAARQRWGWSGSRSPDSARSQTADPSTASRGHRAAVVRRQLYDLAHPAGIFNNGFARTWMTERMLERSAGPGPGCPALRHGLVRTDPELPVQPVPPPPDPRRQPPAPQRIDVQRRLPAARLPEAHEADPGSHLRVCLQFDDEETKRLRDLVLPPTCSAPTTRSASTSRTATTATPSAPTRSPSCSSSSTSTWRSARRGSSSGSTCWSRVVFGDGSDAPLSRHGSSARTSPAAEFESRPRVRALLESRRVRTRAPPRRPAGSPPPRRSR